MLSAGDLPAPELLFSPFSLSPLGTIFRCPELVAGRKRSSAPFFNQWPCLLVIMELPLNALAGFAKLPPLLGHRGVLVQASLAVGV
jgi:hypothetical protein